MKRLVLGVSAACLVLAAIVAAVAVLGDPGGARSAGSVPSSPDGRSRSDATPGERFWLDAEIKVIPLNGTPKVDYALDLDDGATKPLPDAVIRTLGEPGRKSPYPAFAQRYAASRDGSQLAYVGIGDEGTPQIFISGIDGTGVRQMTRGPSAAFTPAWSPDAGEIAYWSSGRVFLLDVAGGESTPLDSGPVDRWSGLQFTPDGSSVLYTKPDYKYGESQLRTVPIDGGKGAVFIGPDQGFFVGDGALSPDGSLVTMLGNEVDGPGAVRFVANADGTHHRTIVGMGSNPAGTWSPDGTRIVCMGAHGKGSGSIIVVDVATGRLTPVAKGTGAIWLDEDTLLVEVS